MPTKINMNKKYKIITVNQMVNYKNSKMGIIKLKSFKMNKKIMILTKKNNGWDGKKLLNILLNK